MDQDEIFNQVKSIVLDRLNVTGEAVNLESSFIEQLGADSLDMVELVMALEEKFNIEITDEEAEQIRTVGDAVRYIESHASSVKG